MLKGKICIVRDLIWYRRLKSQKPCNKQPKYNLNLNLSPTATESTSSPGKNKIPFACTFLRLKSSNPDAQIVQPISCWVLSNASLQTKWCGCEGLKMNLVTNMMFFNAPFMAGCSMDPRGNNVVFCVACVCPPSLSFSRWQIPGARKIPQDKPGESCHLAFDFKLGFDSNSQLKD